MESNLKLLFELNPEAAFNQDPEWVVKNKPIWVYLNQYEWICKKSDKEKSKFCNEYLTHANNEFYKRLQHDT